MGLLGPAADAASGDDPRVYSFAYYDREHRRRMMPNPHPELTDKAPVNIVTGPLKGGEMYAAYITRNGNLANSPIIITGQAGRDYKKIATRWEFKRSTLTSAMMRYDPDTVTISPFGMGMFDPVVEPLNTADFTARVVAHVGWVRGDQLLTPAWNSKFGTDPRDLVAQEAELFVAEDNSDRSRPPTGWLEAGISNSQYWRVLAWPNGQVYGIKDKRDGEGLESANWILYGMAAFRKGFSLQAAEVASLGAPDEIQMAMMPVQIANGLVQQVRTLGPRPGQSAGLVLEEMSQVKPKPASQLAAKTRATEMSGGTRSGIGGDLRGGPIVEHLGRRTIIAGEDMAVIRSDMARSHTETGFYDVFVHGDATSFHIVVGKTVAGEPIWREVSVREVADAIRTRLAPGDQIRLLSCKVGRTGGPAQQLANEVNRTVWAAGTTVWSVPQATGAARRSFVPKDGGKFFAFDPQSR